AARGRADRALHVVALAQTEPADLRCGHVRVVATGEVTARAEEAVALVPEVEQSFERQELAGELLPGVALLGPFAADAVGAFAIPSAAAAPPAVAGPVVVAQLLRCSPR